MSSLIIDRMTLLPFSNVGDFKVNFEILSMVETIWSWLSNFLPYLIEFLRFSSTSLSQLNFGRSWTVNGRILYSCTTFKIFSKVLSQLHVLDDLQSWLTGDSIFFVNFEIFPKFVPIFIIRRNENHIRHISYWVQN